MMSKEPECLHHMNLIPRRMLRLGELWWQERVCSLDTWRSASWRTWAVSFPRAGAECYCPCAVCSFVALSFILLFYLLPCSGGEL